MYTLEQLQGKSLAELKEIDQQLNVSPGDRRRRQSWIDAIPGVNPPLLAMLESSPAATASVIEHEQAEPIVETAKASSVAEIEEVQEPIESKFGRIVYPRPATKIESQMSQSAIGSAAKTSLQTNAMNKKGTISQKYWEAIKILPGFAGNHQDVVYRELKNMNYRWDSKTKKWIYPIEQMAKTSPGVGIDPVPEAIAEAVEDAPGVEVDPVRELLEQEVQNAIVQATKTPSRVVVASEPIGSDCWGEDEDEWEGYWGDLYREDEEERI